MNQLAADRLGEALDGVLGGAIGRLQGNAAIREPSQPGRWSPGRANHALQRRHRAVHEAEVGHLGHALVVGGGHLRDRREDRAKSVVDPDVDRPEFIFHGRRRALHPIRVGHVGGNDAGLAPQRLDVAPGCFQASVARASNPICAPWRAKARTVARPTPADAPVTTTTSGRFVPASRRLLSSSLRRREVAHRRISPSPLSGS